MVQKTQPEKDLEEQFTRWYPVIFRYFRLRGADADTANDLASAVFERALQQIHRFDPRKGAFSTWLFTIAHNTAANHWRAQAARPVNEIEDLEKFAGEEKLPESALIALQDQSEVLAALGDLGERERDLLAMKFASRLTNRQIAALTGLSESNVGVILYRALHRMRTAILQNTGEVSRE